MKFNYWKRIVVALGVMYGINLIDRGLVGALLPWIKQDLHLSIFVAGALTSSFFLAYIVGNLGGGYLTDRWGSRRMMKIVTAVFTLITALTALIQQGYQLLILRLGLGLVEAPDLAATFRHLTNWFGRTNRGKGTSFFMLSYSIGVFLPPLIALPLMNVFHSWQVIFLLLIIPGAIAYYLVHRYVFNTPADALERGKISKEEYEHIKSAFSHDVPEQGVAKFASVDRKQLLADKSLWLITLLQFFQLSLTYGFSLWLTTYVLEAIHAPRVTIEYILAMSLIVGIFGVWMAGWLHDRFFSKNNKYLFTVYFIAQAIGLAILLVNEFNPNTGTLFLGFAVVAASLLGNFVPLSTVLQKRYPEYLMGTATGIQNGVGQIGSFAIPTIAGALIVKVADGLSFERVFIFFVVLALVAAFCALFLNEKPLAMQKDIA